MYCNYCSSLNPDDSVYCRACGRTIELLSEPFEKEAGESGPDDESEVVADEVLDSVRLAEPHIEEEFQREYAGMDDEELGQLQEAYERLSVPLPPGLHDELELRALTKGVRALLKGVEDGQETVKQGRSAYNRESPSPSKPQPGLNGKAKDERARSGALRNWLQHGWERLVSRGSMNRRQRTCLWIGFFVLNAATLFPPWTYSYRSRSPGLPRLPRLPALAGSSSGSSSVSSYGFLFHPPFGGARVDLNRLFVEWVLIVLLASGFFFSQAKRPTLTTEKEPDPLAAAGPCSIKVRSYFKVNYPGLAREFIGHVDDRERVTLWEDGQPAPTGLTRDQLETYGVIFKTATEHDITRHTGVQNPKTYRAGKLWQRKFVIPTVVALAVMTIGTADYASRRIARDLPGTETAKLAGLASITNYGRFVWNAYNGSDFVLTEVRISISVFDEKGNAVISNRIYRVPAYDFYPQQTKELGTDVGFTLGQGQTWGWEIVAAKGRPE